MIRKHRVYFIGCPLFGLHFEAAPREAVTVYESNPTDKFFATERRGRELWMWIGKRVTLVWEPRHMREHSPLLIIE